MKKETFKIFDEKPTEAKRHIISNLSGANLFKVFKAYHDNFDPIDYEFCETYDLLSKEIILRCSK